MSHRKIILVLLSFLLLSCSLSIVILGCGNNKEKAKEHYERAIAYIDQENKRMAIMELEKAVELDPNLADAYYKLGVIYYDGSLYDKAIQAYKKVFSIDPNYPRLSLALANVYYGHGLKKWAAAIKLNLEYMFPDTLSQPVYEREEEYQKGIEECKNTLSQNPQDGEALSKLSFIYYSLAQTYYQKALKEDPADPMAHYGLGLTYSEKGYEQRALAEAEILKKLDPELRDALLNLVDRKEQEKQHFKEQIKETVKKP